MADKKLLEESVIARFQQLANISGTSKSVLSEGTKVKLSGQEPAGGRSAFPMASQGVRGPVREAEMEDEETQEEGWMKEASEEEAAAPVDDMGMSDMAGDEMGATSEGGDLESAVSSVVDALNGLLDAAGLNDKKVEMDSEEDKEEEEKGSGEEEEEGMAAPVMEKKDKKKHEEEEEEEQLDESIEVIDDSLIEKLVQRVSARLVAEARKAKSLEEGKKGGAASVRKAAGLGVTKAGKPPKAKGSPVKGGTPFKGGKK